MANYKSQLKGWAVDRVIEWARAAKKEPDFQTMKDLASDLAEYAYVSEEDLEATAASLFELVRNAPPEMAKIDALIGTMEHIKEDRIRQQIDKMPGDKNEHH